MKNKNKIITISIIALCAISIIGLLLLIANSNSKKNIESNNESISLCSMDVKLNSETDITVEPDKCEGYVCANSFVFTKNIDKEKAAEALKPYMIFYDGKPIHTDIKIDLDFNSSDRNYVSVDCTFPDGKGHHTYSSYRVIDSPDGVEFAAVTPFDFFRYACVIDKSTCPSGYDVNKTPYYANTSFYRNIYQPTYNLNYNDSLQEENEIWSDSTFMTGNGKYHTISANVRILDNLCVDGFQGTSNNHDTYQGDENTNKQMEQQFPESEAPSANDPANPNYNGGEANNNSVNEDNNNSFFDSIKQGFNDFKTDIANNQTFRIVTITLSSIVGIALIYVVFLIVRKVWRVIKN